MSTADLPPDLSCAEELLWYADQHGARAWPFIDCAPSLSLVVRLSRALDPRALEASLTGIVRRHAVLRSRFVAEQGRPMRRCDAPATVPIKRLDWTDTPRAWSRNDLLGRLTALIEAPFDLARGPLLRAYLIALASHDHILAVTIHHIVFDRWSRRVLALELKALYEAYGAHRSPDLAPLAAGYETYIQWQRDLASGAVGRGLADYWTQRLSGSADLLLPTDGPRDVGATSTCAGTFRFTINPERTAGLVATSRRYRTTITTTLLVLFTTLLHLVTGQDDLCVGVPLGDRRRPEFEHLIGLFANVVVVRTRITRRMTMVDLLGGVRRELVDACKYQDVPYARLVRLLETRRPLYRVLLNVMPEITSTDLELEGVALEPLTVAVERQSFSDLSLHVTPRDGGLACRFVYKAALFSTERIERLGARFQALVPALADEPDGCVVRLDAVSGQ